jgi:site-specific recombinase XerD
VRRRVALQHTFSLRLRERAWNLRIVQTPLGHRQLGTTEAYERDQRRVLVIAKR